MYKTLLQNRIKFINKYPSYNKLDKVDFHR
jgi:hypothetical protein